MTSSVIINLEKIKTEREKETFKFMISQCMRVTKYYYNNVNCDDVKKKSIFFHLF